MMGDANSSSPKWVATAQKLRHVRQTCLLFLDQWAIGCLMADSPDFDRAAKRLSSSLSSASSTRHRLPTDENAAQNLPNPADAQTEAAIADPANRDWSVLYRGSILDD